MCAGSAGNRRSISASRSTERGYIAKRGWRAGRSLVRAETGGTVLKRSVNAEFVFEPLEESFPAVVVAGHKGQEPNPRIIRQEMGNELIPIRRAEAVADDHQIAASLPQYLHELDSL